MAETPTIWYPIAWNASTILWINGCRAASFVHTRWAASGSPVRINAVEGLFQVAHAWQNPKDCPPAAVASRLGVVTRPGSPNDVASARRLSMVIHTTLCWVIHGCSNKCVYKLLTWT